MRILFAGTPEIAVPALESISRSFEVCAVLTNPDKVRARGGKILPSPVKAAAERLGIPVLQPDRLLAAGRNATAEFRPDLLVTYAYGRIFGPRFLDLFPLGGLNVHPSLLPQLRGSSPIQSAILEGLPETGITIQRIALAMDTGDILLQRRVMLDGRETTESLTSLMGELGADLLVDALTALTSGTLESLAQDERMATYCRKIEKDDRIIDWTKSGETLDREVRAFFPWPKSASRIQDRQLMITCALPAGDEQLAIPSGQKRPAPGSVLAPVTLPLVGSGIPVVCGTGGLLVSRLQFEGRKELDWRNFLNGFPAFIGSRFDM